MSACINLLVIEDNPADFRLIVRHLEKHGLAARCHCVTTIEEMEAAVELGGWDALLSDYSVPKLDFQHTLGIIQARYPDLPLILVSGSIGEEKAVGLLRQGVWDFVLKDNLTRLVPAIEHSLLDAADQREHRRAEAALRESEERHRTILQTAIDGFWLADIQGRLLEVNGAYCRMSGYNEQELLALRIPDLEANEAAPDIAARIQKIVAQGEDRFESRHRRKDGSLFDVEVNVQYQPTEDGRIVAFLRDVTERKRAEEALRMSEEKYRTIFRAAPVPMALNDDRQRVTFLNPAFVQTFGYTLDDIPTLADWWLKAYPNPAYRQQVAETWQAALEQSDRAKEETFSPNEVTVRCKNGTDKTVLVNATSLLGSLADTHLVVLYDITERKRAEAELMKMDKLQSVGTLAGGIAHDFNNILQGLYGNISLAIDDLSQTHPSYELLQDAEKSMTRAVRLTRQLLTFSKGGDPVKETVGLGAMAEEVARFDLTGSNVSLDCHHDDDLWPVDADRGQIQQVISNLVINARQAMPKGGKLTITLENANLPGAAVPGLSPGRYVKVTAQDEGGGIDPRVLGRIFDPYFTTKQNGNGLGLATVWSIINKHGGHIGVVSELGKGTTFTLHLPASASPAPAAANPPAAACPTPARPASILVMDDEVTVCDLAAKMLLRCGYSATTAPGGEETVALYRQALAAGAPFDAVIMDLTIPGGPGGKEVIKALLAIDPRVRVIVSSGYADDPVMADPAAYGFKGTVAKPYTARALREAMARVLA